MMSRRLGRYFLIGTVLGLLLATGCAPSRARYYSGLRASRLQAYHRWERQNREELTRPKIEGELSLEEAVRLSLEYSPQLQAALEGKARARGRLIEAYSEALPTVEVSADYTRLDQVFSVDLGVESFQVGDKDNYSYRIRITQPLFKGGTIPIAQRSARLFSYLSDEVVRGTAHNVIFQVARAYYDTLLAEHLIEVQEAALESAQAHLKDVDVRRQQGVATEYDVLRARVDVSNVQADLIEQRNRLDLARTSLLRAIGVSQRSSIELTTDLSYQEIAPDFFEAVKGAFENRPDIYQAVLNLDLQHEAVNEAYTHYLPRLEAYYWRLWAKPDPHVASMIEWGRQWQAGLSLTWTLFDGLAREGKIIQQNALLRQRQILLSDAEEQAIQEIRNAVLELQNAEELVQSQGLNLDRAQRALKLVQIGYREGVNTELEVLDGGAALTRTRGLYHTALHRHVAARLDLQRAMGILGPRGGTQGVPEQIGIPGYIEAFAKETEKTVEPRKSETP